MDVLAHCILTTLRTLSQEPDNISDPFGAPLIGAERDAVSLLERVKKLHGIADPPFYSLPS